MSFALQISSTHRISLLITRPERLSWAVDALQADGLEVTIDTDGSNLHNLVPDLLIFNVEEASRVERDMLHAVKAHPLTAPVPILFICADTEPVRVWCASLSTDINNFRIAPLSPVELRTWVQARRIHYGLAFPEDVLPSGIHSVANDQDLIRAAKKHLSAHHAKEDAAEHVATTLKVERIELDDMFYASQGITISEFLTQERIRNAQRLLLQSSLDIAAIAVALGYASVVQFSEAFHEVTGLTPVAYRCSSGADSLTTQGVMRWSST
ncbi:helix-turn-helix transcriptional regulator [Alcaligenaceae bacterium]|nr:helix-turn-helix transcriptional regulator [Alcaligenaceae bacterium]